MTDRFPDFVNPAVDSSGNVISGARLFFYRVGTSTKKDTYSNSIKTVLNANPVVANGDGRFGDIFMLTDEQYKVILADAGIDDPPSFPIKTWDNVSPVLDNPTARIPVLSKSSTYNVAVSDRGKLIEADASGGAFSVNLPAAATATNGFTIRVKKVDSTTNAVTVDADGAETIDGVTTRLLIQQYDFVDLVSDGTEWHVVGSFEQPGLWEQIGTTTTASDDATIDFTWASITYQKVMLIINLARPATDDVEGHIRTSTDGGSTFDAGVGDYSWSVKMLQHGSSSISEDFGESADTQINVTGTGATFGVGNATDEGWSGTIEIMFPAEATDTYINIHGGYQKADNSQELVVANGVRDAAADVDGIRFFFSSGNITSGTFAAYGLK